MRKYMEASPEAGKEFYQHFHNKGKVVMLNLLKFRATADYTNLGGIEARRGNQWRRSVPIIHEEHTARIRKGRKPGNLLWQEQKLSDWARY